MKPEAPLYGLARRTRHLCESRSSSPGAWGQQHRVVLNGITHYREASRYYYQAGNIGNCTAHWAEVRSASRSKIEVHVQASKAHSRRMGGTLPKRGAFRPAPFVIDPFNREWWVGEKTEGLSTGESEWVTAHNASHATLPAHTKTEFCGYAFASPQNTDFWYHFGLAAPPRIRVGASLQLEFERSSLLSRSSDTQARRRDTSVTSSTLTLPSPDATGVESSSFP